MAQLVPSIQENFSERTIEKDYLDENEDKNGTGKSVTYITKRALL